MILRLEVFCMHFFEVTFFTGLVGCCLVVVISWISIFAEGFSDKEDIPPN